MENKSNVEAFSGTKVDFLPPSVLGHPNIGVAPRSTERSVNQVCAMIVAANVPEKNMLSSEMSKIAVRE